MDIRELVEELNSWNAPNADITICGADIDRVTNIGANTFSIVPETDYSIDDRIEELENDIDEKDSEIRDLTSEIEDWEDFVEDLKDDMDIAVKILKEINENSEAEDFRILDLIQKLEDDIDKEIY